MLGDAVGSNELHGQSCGAKLCFSNQVRIWYVTKLPSWSLKEQPEGFRMCHSVSCPRHPLADLLVQQPPHHAVNSTGQSPSLGKRHGSFYCLVWWRRSLPTTMRWKLLDHGISLQLIIQTVIAARCVMWGMHRRCAHCALKWIPSVLQSLSNASHMVSLFDALSAMIAITYMLNSKI